MDPCAATICASSGESTVGEVTPTVRGWALGTCVSCWAYAAGAVSASAATIGAMSGVLFIEDLPVDWCQKNGAADSSATGEITFPACRVSCGKIAEILRGEARDKAAMLRRPGGVTCSYLRRMKAVASVAGETR